MLTRFLTGCLVAYSYPIDAYLSLDASVLPYAFWRELQMDCEERAFWFSYMVVAEGVEPTRPFGQIILSDRCLPFHHATIQEVIKF
jgi:hypothetical protein